MGKLRGNRLGILLFCLMQMSGRMFSTGAVGKKRSALLVALQRDVISITDFRLDFYLQCPYRLNENACTYRRFPSG